MANRRMFSKDIVRSDAFLDMPISSQLLYFHLGMDADDDGFVSSPKRMSRMIGANEDDLKILISKRFILTFDSGIIVIKHWRINNELKKDRYKETQYLEEKKALILKENGSYTECIQNVSIMEAQDRIGKDRIGKVNTMSAVPSDASPPNEAFEKFWKEYPKKELKAKSREIWKRKKLDSKLEIILEFVVKASKTDRWIDGYIKQPTTFLNNSCWEDDLTAYMNFKQEAPQSDLIQ